MHKHSQLTLNLPTLIVCSQPSVFMTPLYATSSEPAQLKHLQPDCIQCTISSSLYMFVGDTNSSTPLSRVLLSTVFAV